jgi:hypothetical protein
VEVVREVQSGQADGLLDQDTWRIARDVYIADTSARARREVLEGTLARDWRQYFLPLLRRR